MCLSLCELGIADPHYTIIYIIGIAIDNVINKEHNNNNDDNNNINNNTKMNNE